MTIEIRDLSICIYIYLTSEKKENRIHTLNRKRVINYFHEFRK